jgi:hypothetical protein
MTNQIYLYKNWTELFDRLKTAPNERGVFTCAPFLGDEHRFMVASIGEKKRTSVQIKDYVFNKTIEIPAVFGDDDESNLSNMVGDVSLDEFGETILVVNEQAMFIRRYSIMDLRFDQGEAKPL